MSHTRSRNAARTLGSTHAASSRPSAQTSGDKRAEEKRAEGKRRYRESLVAFAAEHRALLVDLARK